jgi:hypothetical protein
MPVSRYDRHYCVILAAVAALEGAAAAIVLAGDAGAWFAEAEQVWLGEKDIHAT